MGREIRRVPPNWQHPKDENGEYVRMYDQDFETAIEDWITDYRQWQAGTHPVQLDPRRMEIWKGCPYWEIESPPPDPEYYRPKFTEPATWYQVYETVSEGTPVTPPFATKEELIDYLIENGDFWDQTRKVGGWSRAAAERFIRDEYQPSGMIIPGVGIKMGRDITETDKDF